MNIFAFSEFLYSNVTLLFWGLLLVGCSANVIRHQHMFLWVAITLVALGVNLVMGGVKAAFELSLTQTYLIFLLYLVVGFLISIRRWNNKLSRVRNVFVATKSEFVVMNNLSEDWFNDPANRKLFSYAHCAAGRLWVTFQLLLISKGVISKEDTSIKSSYEDLMKSLIPDPIAYGPLITIWIGYWPLVFLREFLIGSYIYVSTNMIGIYSKRAREEFRDLA